MAGASQAGYVIVGGGIASTRASQIFLQSAFGPPAARSVGESQVLTQIAGSGGNTNVAARVSSIAVNLAYRPGDPGISRQDAWTFVLDGHRFYYLPLGNEGDWAYDTTTKEWCQMQTQGFNGMNFTHGTMWDVRIMGGDALNPILLEMDPNQPFDDGFRPVEHIVTGGLATRGRHAVGVANFTITASVGDDASIDQPISLAFSDDNGVSWSAEFPIPLTDIGSQLLIWNALGSFNNPGRVFRVTDYGGPIRLDGADAVLTIGSGADSGQDENG